MKKILLALLSISILSMPGIVFASHSPPTPLIVTLTTSGDFDTAGDQFNATVKIKNIGDEPLLLITIKMEGIPNDWIVIPSSRSTNWLPEGDEQTFKFKIIRGATDADIYASADPYYPWQPPVYSNIIHVPINVIVLILLFASFITFSLYQLRQKHERN